MKIFAAIPSELANALVDLDEAWAMISDMIVAIGLFLVLWKLVKWSKLDKQLDDLD